MGFFDTANETAAFLGLVEGAPDLTGWENRHGIWR
jgi:hypothetical protein